MQYIKFFDSISMDDSALVGGKTASLGQMMQSLSSNNIIIPNGFAITAQAYWHFVSSNQLMPSIEQIMSRMHDYSDTAVLHSVGNEIRNLFINADMPKDLTREIVDAYTQLSKQYNDRSISVAVRSSATAEDLPGASFAGQQETFLNISGKKKLLQSCKECFASLFTDRAIVYRHDKEFDFRNIALSIAVQKMVRADLGTSGVAFSLDTESGFKDVIIINASYGLGEAIVQGMVVPDEYHVFKQTLTDDYKPIIKKVCGNKNKKIVYKKKGTTIRSVPKIDQQKFCLSDHDIIYLAKAVSAIEKYYSAQKGSWSPMDVEWAKDGTDNTIYILQARPETIHARENAMHISRYELQANPQILVQGQSIGQKIVSGVARVIQDKKDIAQVQAGDIIITQMTDPDWVPALKKAVAIVTQTGGRTCHAAIIARELQIPALVGAQDALKKISTGALITLDCSQGQIGYIYEGKIPFRVTNINLSSIQKPPVDVMINCADPDRAYALSALPIDGVGLARMEFIITNTIKIHPLALLHCQEITDKKIIKYITQITSAYSDFKTFFIDNLAFGIGTIAAAFYPKPVIVRLSDFKTNEYRNLIGGNYFEPHEENPMIGFRGAIRYYSDGYKDAFALECAALKKVREQMGLTNITIMVPFVRTVQEGKKVLALMKEQGLVQSDSLDIIMMCEIPSNVVLIDDFLKDFDGISIGSNDLTQLTLGVDRDSSLLQGIFDERDPAMKKMFELAIEGAKRANKYSGICGQAPSDYPELAEFLIAKGIQSVSLNPDSVLPFLTRFANRNN